MRINLLCIFVIFCLDASLVFGIESKVKENEIKSRKRVAGIWVLDKDKMQKEIEAVLKQAKVRAKELGIESAEEQLKRLEKSHQKNLEHVAMMIYHFNKDGSGGIFPSLAGAKGMRGTYAGAVMLLLWKAEDEKVKLAMYRRPFGYTKVREANFLFEGDNLVVQANNPVREIKADETNLHILFDLKKFYFRKVDPNDKAARKPKVLLPKEVKLETPEGFGKPVRKHNEGFGGETVEYIKISDHDEKISLSFTAAYELAGYNRPGGKKATYDEVVAILIKGRHEKCMESYPKAKLSTGVEMLDGIKAGYVEGLLDENSKDMKGPYYIKQYVLVDDGITMLTISILAKSTERIKFMDDYVKKIKLNMTKTWVVTMKEVMEAKRKGDEYMKKKSGK